MNNGRLVDVLIEPRFYTDPTGIKQQMHIFTVWADEGNTETIQAVEGVRSVHAPLSPTQYDVFIDKRYDLDFVAAEIEAAILCKEA